MKLIVLICMLIEILLCQTIMAQQISNVEIRCIKNAIEVTYDLSGPEHLRMDVTVVFTDKISSEKIIPQTISGDVKNVKPGRGKIITWQVLNDRQFIDAEIRANVSATFAITQQEHNQATTGGPGNALLSALMPGLGDVFVNGDEKPIIKPAYITLLFLGSAGLAWYCHQESENYYQAYQTSVQQYEINSNYEKAVYYADNAKLMTGIAATIWVMDVIRVAAKGSANRRDVHNVSSKGTLSFTPGLTKATLVYKF